MLFLLYLAPVTCCLAQDERFFRDLFSFEQRKRQELDNKHYLFQVASPFYRYDIDDDGKEESFVLEKRDGDDWINIHDEKGKRVSSFALMAQGLDSKIHKISVRKLSQKTKLFILYFYEGLHKHVNLKSTERAYFLTVDDKNLKSARLFRGPLVWDEASFKNHYHQRRYELYLYDYNNDGVKEVGVKHQYISHVYMYLKEGQWREL